MYHPIVGNLWFKTFMSAFFTFVELNEYHVISNDEVYPFLPCYWPYKLFIEMSKKICVSGFHVHFKRNKSFISLEKLSPPAQPEVLFCLSFLLDSSLKLTGTKKFYTNR